MAAPTSHPATAARTTAELRAQGQAIWLDFIHRDLIATEQLAQLVRDDGLSGVTSNPAIFEKAMVESDAYVDAISTICRKNHRATPKEIFEQLAIRDIQDAADVLRTAYDETSGRDGYACLEVAPDLARNTASTIDEARRLWRSVNRPNVMIKVPGTIEGLPAIRELLTDGINVNITLLFSRDRYEAVAASYLDALEARRAAGERIDRVASVASFFISRIDTAVDALLSDRITAAPEKERPSLEQLLGTAGISNAKIAYSSFKAIFSGRRWDWLASQGGQLQRVLWASTSVKNPKYRDTRYVEEMIGPSTVDTMPLETLTAFRDHGRVRASLEEGIDGARDTLAAIERAGISMKAVTDRLLDEGIDKFVEPYVKLLKTIEHRCAEVRASSGR